MGLTTSGAYRRWAAAIFRVVSKRVAAKAEADTRGGERVARECEESDLLVLVVHELFILFWLQSYSPVLGIFANSVDGRLRDVRKVLSHRSLF